MTKGLVRHEHSAALILDKPILELLNITMDTPLEASELTYVEAAPSPSRGYTTLPDHMPPQHRWYAEWSSTPTAFANLVDLAPTLLEQAAAEPLSDADGRSLAPLLAGSTPADWPDDVFAEFHGYETTLYSARMIRTADW